MALLCQIVDPITALTRPADGPPQGALVLLHGRGSSEHDLVDLFDLVDPERRRSGSTSTASPATRLRSLTARSTP
jgi:predicted esterase